MVQVQLLLQVELLITGTACLADDCYTMNMTDAYGDGWNGGTYSITDNNSGTVLGTGGLTSGAAGSDLLVLVLHVQFMDVLILLHLTMTH